MIIDLASNNPKKWGYPEIINVDFNSNKGYHTFYLRDSSILSKNHVIKLTPSTPLSIVSPGIEASYERKAKKNFSYQASASYLFPIYVWDITYRGPRPSIAGYSLGLEGRKYLRTPLLGPYLALEARFFNAHYRDVETFEPEERGFLSYAYQDTIKIRRQLIDFNLKIGYQWVLAKRLVIDAYAGIGLRYRDVRHRDRLRPRDFLLDYDSATSFYNTYLERLDWTVRVPY